MGLGNGLYFLMSFEGSSYWFESVNRGRAFLRELSKNHKVRHECISFLLMREMDALSSQKSLASWADSYSLAWHINETNDT